MNLFPHASMKNVVRQRGINFTEFIRRRAYPFLHFSRPRFATDNLTFGPSLPLPLFAPSRLASET